MHSTVCFWSTGILHFLTVHYYGVTQRQTRLSNTGDEEEFIGPISRYKC